MFLPLLCAVWLAAQQSSEDISRVLDRQPCAESPRVKICHYDYIVDGAAVEALSFVPTGAGPFPAAGGRFIAIVYTERRGRTRIISARPANRTEREAYERRAR